MPQIEILKPITGNLAEKFAKCFPEGVISVDTTNGIPTAVVLNPRLDTVSRECLRHPEFSDSVRLTRIYDHFICTPFNSSIVHLAFSSFRDCWILFSGNCCAGVPQSSI